MLLARANGRLNQILIPGYLDYWISGSWPIRILIRNLLLSELISIRACQYRARKSALSIVAVVTVNLNDPPVRSIRGCENELRSIVLIVCKCTLRVNFGAA